MASQSRTTPLVIKGLKRVVDGVQSKTLSSITLHVTPKQKISIVSDLLGDAYGVVGCETCGKVDAFILTRDCEYPLEAAYGKCEKCDVKVCLECAAAAGLSFLCNDGSKCACYYLLCTLCIDASPEGYCVDLEQSSFECAYKHKKTRKVNRRTKK